MARMADITSRTTATAMARPPGPWIGAALAMACGVLFVTLVVLRPLVPGDAAVAAPLDNILLWDSLLPRTAIALIAGAGLGLAGALLQRVLRNPVADASTLGIASGAQLALVVSVGLFPALSLARDLVAFGGGLAAVALVMALGWRRGLDPATVAIAGMIVGMVCAGISVTIILARGEYAMSLSIWGSGALNQQDWRGTVSLGLQVLVVGGLALFLNRPLTLLALGDDTAKSLGAALQTLRFAVLILAVWLAASVTSTVGILGFLGLAAPTIARLCGARTPGQILLAAPATGAALPFLTDAVMQLLGPGFNDLAPAGAATALFGGPLLLMLLRRVHPVSVARVSVAGTIRRLQQPVAGLVVLAVLIAVVIGVALIVSPVPSGWSIAFGPAFTELLPFRLWRTLGAAAAGGLVGGAGFVMQRMTGNPLASPEVLGVSSGAGAGLAGVLFLFGFVSPPAMLVAMMVGALLAFLMMLALSARSHFSAERFLLAGIAVSAVCMAVVTMMQAQGDMRAYVLLAWLSGSTARLGAFEGGIGLGTLAIVVIPLIVLRRWLVVLPLGSGMAEAIGLRVRRSRLVLALLAAMMTAVSAFLIGPLSLAGLISPHLARLIGFSRPTHQMAAAIMIGAGVLTLADWLSRVVIYPYQVSTGLFATLIGGPYLLWLLTRRSQ